MKLHYRQKLLIMMSIVLSANVFSQTSGFANPQIKTKTKTNKAVVGSNGKTGLSASTKTATAAVPATKVMTSTVDPAVMNQIKADFDSAIDGSVIPRIGETMAWANGTLTRTASNQLKYVNDKNGYYETTLTKDSDLTKLAKDNGDIRNTWVSQYGVNLAAIDESPDQLDAYKKQVAHIYMYGLGDNYTKENPWDLGMGLGAFKKDGKVVFYNKNGPLSYNDLLNTNEYKAQAGTNLVHSETEVSGIPAAVGVEDKDIDKDEVDSTGNMDYIGNASNSSIDMLIAASVKYKAGTISKDQYISVALSVSRMAEYHKKVKSSSEKGMKTAVAPAAPAAPNAPTANTSSDRVLIGTANNGQDKIYSVKLNSWDQKAGYKVVIVPKNPIVSKEYELTVPYSDIKPGSNEIENILSNIPANFKVDKTADNKPIVKNDPNAVGLWRLTKESSAICVHSAVRIAQPEGSCDIGDTAKSSSGAGWANDKKPAEKNCIEKGFEKVKYDYDFECVADIYKNTGGM